MTSPAEHLGDRVSALLDGELTDGDVRDAEAHLAGCERCRAELAATSSARALLRGLAAVEPPFGLFERLAVGTRRRSTWRRGVAAVVSGAAAAVLLLVMATPAADPVDLPVGALVERHAASASSGGDPVTEFVPAGVSVSFEP